MSGTDFGVQGCLFRFPAPLFLRVFGEVEESPIFVITAY